MEQIIFRAAILAYAAFRQLLWLAIAMMDLGFVYAELG